jgi:hypothetical protein
VNATANPKVVATPTSLPPCSLRLDLVLTDSPRFTVCGQAGLTGELGFAVCGLRPFCLLDRRERLELPILSAGCSTAYLTVTSRRSSVDHRRAPTSPQVALDDPLGRLQPRCCWCLRRLGDRPLRRRRRLTCRGRPHTARRRSGPTHARHVAVSIRPGSGRSRPRAPPRRTGQPMSAQTSRTRHRDPPAPPDHAQLSPTGCRNCGNPSPRAPQAACGNPGRLYDRQTTAASPISANSEQSSPPGRNPWRRLSVELPPLTDDLGQPLHVVADRHLTPLRRLDEQLLVDVGGWPLGFGIGVGSGFRQGHGPAPGGPYPGGNRAGIATWWRFGSWVGWRLRVAGLEA